jgi:hypothetical protein
VVVVERQAVAVHGLQREPLPLVVEVEAVASRWPSWCAAGRAGQVVALLRW